ncbi:hypothetical protein ACTMTU_10805 [Streptomyces sp. OZ13]
MTYGSGRPIAIGSSGSFVNLGGNGDFDDLRGVDFRGASPRCSPTEAAYG